MLPETDRSRSTNPDTESGRATSSPLRSRRSRRRLRTSSRSNMRSEEQDQRISADDILREILTELGCTEEDDSKRIQALDWLERILARWSMSCDRESGGTASSTSDPCSKESESWSPTKKKARPPAGANSWQRPRPVLVTFGSYRLGVHRPSSDLDLLVLAPSHCTREDFFSSLVALLKQQNSDIVQHVHPIPTAYTPVIKFVLFGLSVDLLFARGDSQKILQHQQKRPNPLLMAGTSSGDHRSDEYVIDDTDLEGQDEAGVRSLNGARVSQMILNAVPHVETFQTVLIAVKQWAMAKGVYSNVLGFLGGINYAIMVAYLCIHNPSISSPVALLEEFFRTFATWKWPKPLMIGELQSEPPARCRCAMAAWNPAVNRRDQLHIMPIITPAFPAMNSAYNVDKPQLRRMVHEMTLAANWMTTCRKSRHACLYHLFRPSDFFFCHQHFLQVTVTSKTEQEHVEWLRLVESRLRLLISSVETPEIHAWPFAKFFDRPAENDTTIANKANDQDFETSFFIALRFAPGTTRADLRVLTSDFCHQVNSWDKRTVGMDLALGHILATDLPAYVVPPLKAQDDASTETASSSGASSTADFDEEEDAQSDDQASELQVPPTGVRGYKETTEAKIKPLQGAEFMKAHV